VGNEVLHRVQGETDIPHTVESWKANWIGRTLCRNCLLKQVPEGGLEGSRRGGRRKQLLDACQGEDKVRNLKGKPLDPLLRRTRFGRGIATQ
jgi:hypothetical protein